MKERIKELLLVWLGRMPPSRALSDKSLFASFSSEKEEPFLPIKPAMVRLLSIERIAALMRAAAFFALFKWVLVPFAVRPAVHWASRTFAITNDIPHHVISPLLSLTQELVVPTVTLGLVALLVLTERREDSETLAKAVLQRSYLLDPVSWLRRATLGAATGLALVSLVLGILAALGMFSLRIPVPSSPTVIVQQALLITLFAAVGLTEEMFFRGYLLRTLTDGTGFPVAALLTSAWFAIGHYIEGDTLAGGCQSFLYALFCCATIHATGSLAFSIGFHAAWDYAQSGLYGVPDSSFIFAGALGRANLHGPVLLTGGAAGPEGSLLTFAADAALLIAFLRRTPAPTSGSRQMR